jgi:hypothetical protein
MTQEHPITPPPELVEQWGKDWYRSKVKHTDFESYIVAKAAQWGADTELEDCCQWLDDYLLAPKSVQLRAARRPEPETLNSIALKMLYTIERMDVVIPEITDTIRRALEALPDG